MTRRDLMGGAVAAAFPIGRVAAADPVGPVMAKLSAYLSEAQGRALPPEVIEKAKHHILDTFAAIISGAQLQPGKVAIAFARARGGEKVATVAGSNVVCGAIDAAFANGMLAHSRISETNGMSVVSGRRLTGFLAGLRRRIRVLCQPRSENCPGLPIFFGEAGENKRGGRE